MTLYYDVLSPDVQVPGVVLNFPSETDVDSGVLKGALEGKLNLRAGAIAELKWHNPETEVWETVNTVPPPPGSRLWVRYAEGPPLLEKVRVPRGSADHAHCEKFLEVYLRPYTANANVKVHLHKVEELSNPECEHRYQLRRRELPDAENIMLVTVGGSKEVVKSIAQFGFELSSEKGPFGVGAMVFGSNIRSVGEDGHPVATDSNKLLICEAALGLPKILTKPTPHLSLPALEAQGYSSAILPPGVPSGPGESEDTMPEHVVLYHPHQAVPRHLLTYTIEELDPEVLCPVSGEELRLVHRKYGSLECLSCAVAGEGEYSSEAYETIEEAARRDRAQFVAQEDNVSVHLKALQKRYEEAETVHLANNTALEAAIDNITENVKEVTSAIRLAGLRLIDDLKDKHRGVRERLDESVIALQTSEAIAADVHRHLNAAVNSNSDVLFERALAVFRDATAKMTLPEEDISTEPTIRDALGFMNAADISKDAEAMLRMCAAMSLSAPAIVGHSSPPRSELLPPPLPPPAADPFEPSNLSAVHSQAISQPSPVVAASAADDHTVEEEVLSDVSPHPPRINLEQPWSPGHMPVNPNTILTKEEALSSRKVKRMMFAFGRNDCGQLGLGHTNSAVDRPAEVAVTGLGCVKHVSSGRRHTVCSLTDGRLFAFGDNAFGQLGLGHRQALSTPSPIYTFSASQHGSVRRRYEGPSTPGTPTQIACGDDHTILLTDTHKVYVWGKNDSGQLGLGHVDDQDTPWELTFLESHTVVQVAAGTKHTACLTQDSLVFTWGCNRDQQLGIGGITSVAFATVPQAVSVPVPHGASVRHISAGDTHTVALIDNSTQLFIWGKNDVGQLGLGHCSPTASPRLVAAVNNPDDPIRGVWAVRGGTVLVTVSGQVVRWGVSPGTPMPTKVASLASLCVERVAAGASHTALLTTTNHVFCYGDDTYGQLGLGRTPTSDVFPQELRLPAKLIRHRHRVLDVVAAGDHTFVVVAVAGSGPLNRP